MIDNTQYKYYWKVKYYTLYFFKKEQILLKLVNNCSLKNKKVEFYVHE